MVLVAPPWMCVLRDDKHLSVFFMQSKESRDKYAAVSILLLYLLFLDLVMRLIVTTIQQLAVKLRYWCVPAAAARLWVQILSSAAHSKYSFGCQTQLLS